MWDFSHTHAKQSPNLHTGSINLKRVEMKSPIVSVVNPKSNSDAPYPGTSRNATGTKEEVMKSFIQIKTWTLHFYVCCSYPVDPGAPEWRY